MEVLVRSAFKMMREGKELQREGLAKEITAIRNLETLLDDHPLKFLGPILRNLTFAGKSSRGFCY